MRNGGGRSACHGRLQVGVDRRQEVLCVEVGLIAGHQNREVLGHLAALDRCDAHLLEAAGEADERLVAVELAAVRQAPGPGEDRRDGVGRRGVALLVLAVVASNSAVSYRVQ